MTNKKSSSFGKSVNKNNSIDQSIEDELLSCLHNLSTIGEGRNRKVDNEITRFKKMIKIRSSTHDLQEQVELITKTLNTSSSLPENSTLIKLFKNMPAKILVDEFLANKISPSLKAQLESYHALLNKNMLAKDCIIDLIEIFNKKIKPSPSLNEKNTNDNGSTENNAEQFKTIINPLLQLFNQIELTKQQKDDYQNMCSRSKDITELNEVSVFVEDASHIILSFITNSSDKFEAFLLQLQQRLDNVSTFINKNKETNLEISKNSDELSNQMSSEVHNIQTSITASNKVGNLTSTISESLEIITKGLTQFDHDRKALEKEASNRISNLEKELVKTKMVTDHLKENLQQQRIRALTDQLTKLPNRHAYNERLHLEYNRWRRYKGSLSLIMGDIDLFKSINDSHGHIAGDAALRLTAKTIQDGIRTTDFAARFGGEEFVILMPETNIKDATKVINKIRLAIQKQTIKEGAAEFKLTMSFGVASFDADDTFTSVLTRADKAMYRAKKKGRNQVCIQLMKD